MTLVRGDCRLELLELDIRTVVRVDRELELGIDHLDVGENGLRFGLGGSDVFRRRGPRRACGQHDERRRRYNGESLQVPSHAALFRRTTLEISIARTTPGKLAAA